MAKEKERTIVPVVVQKVGETGDGNSIAKVTALTHDGELARRAIDAATAETQGHILDDDDPLIQLVDDDVQQGDRRGGPTYGFRWGTAKWETTGDIERRERIKEQERLRQLKALEELDEEMPKN